MSAEGDRAVAVTLRGIFPLLLLSKYIQIRLLDTACGAARGDGAVIDRRPSVCGRIDNEEESEEGKTAVLYHRHNFFSAAFICIGGAVSSRILVRRPHGAAKLGYAVPQLGYHNKTHGATAV